MNKISIPKFDPEEHQNNVYEAFTDFVDEFAYEYDAIAKDPPKDLSEEDKAAWIKQNKRKVFLGKFASRNLQKHFEEAIAAEQRATVSFDDMITALKKYYDGGRNKTLANFEFRKLAQKGDDSFDAFHIRVKRDAAQCDFKCESPTCCVPDILIRDQIVYGTTIAEIRNNCLKNQWGLADLVKNGRAIESATYGAQQIKKEAPDGKVSRVKKPGRFSRKAKMKIEPTQESEKDKRQSKEKSRKCDTCSSNACKGGKKCPGAELECFDCHEIGHFRNAPVCKGKKVTKKSNRVQSESTSSSEESSDSSSTESESEFEGASSRVKRTRRLTKRVTTIRRMRRKSKKVRRTTKPPRYEVEVVINEQTTKAFADTGADISVMSRKQAKALGLKLMVLMVPKQSGAKGATSVL